MTQPDQHDYRVFDTPAVLDVLFHPRAERRAPASGPTLSDLLVTMDDGTRIGTRFHHAGAHDPIIVFFHGNGEIASDYDDLGPLYTGMSINFIVCDYRGYGLSTGRPTVSRMMSDATALFDHLRLQLRADGYTGALIIMGRSLGSASALEIARERCGHIDALIIESGFAFIMPLLHLLGLDDPMEGMCEENGPKNLEKIKTIDTPTLIIHAEFDHIIPFSDGEALFHHSPAENKRLLKIEGADHNTIFYRGLDPYMKAVGDLADTVRPPGR
ncbi:alpha/beta hydrolase [Desulfatiferula olefinivorans]